MDILNLATKNISNDLLCNIINLSNLEYKFKFRLVMNEFKNNITIFKYKILNSPNNIDKVSYMECYNVLKKMYKYSHNNDVKIIKYKIKNKKIIMKYKCINNYIHLKTYDNYNYI